MGDAATNDLALDEVRVRCQRREIALVDMRAGLQARDRDTVRASRRDDYAVREALRAGSEAAWRGNVMTGPFLIGA